MGYLVWGSDTCGYNQQLLEQEVCARWLAFSAFTPIMEVGPTRNTGFWNLPRELSPIWEKGRREASVYLPSGARWRDAWRRERVYDGGQVVRIAADMHQIPLLVREGSGIELGDLGREFAEALAAASKRPDLQALDAGLAARFRVR